ncbi:hypothetical protein [Streptomyces iranensis]
MRVTYDHPQAPAAGGRRPVVGSVTPGLGPGALATPLTGGLAVHPTA